MNLPKAFISCDWGTSSFRLSIVKMESLEVIEQLTTNDGIKHLVQTYSPNLAEDRKSVLINYLLEHVEKLEKDRGNYPIVISGMASSNIGLKELDYADLPIPMDASELICEVLPFPKTRKVILISGIRSVEGVARGEEVQAIGLSQVLQSRNEGLLILPGTHSKQMTFQGKFFLDITTYMTGELFDLLSTKSILAGGLQKEKWSIEQTPFFKRGLDLGSSKSAFANLFKLRVDYLSRAEAINENYFALSGLLIAQELITLRDYKHPIFIAAKEPIVEMYKIALRYLFPKKEIIAIPVHDFENAIFSGHKQILQMLV